MRGGVFSPSSRRELCPPGPAVKHVRLLSPPKIDEFEPSVERHHYWKLIGPGIVLERRFVKHGRFEYDVPGPRKYDGGVDV